VGVKNPRKMEEKPPQFSTFFVVNFLFLVIEAAIEYIEMEIFYLLIFTNLAHQLFFLSSFIYWITYIWIVFNTNSWRLGSTFFVFNFLTVLTS
jgi:hypothetical protein